MDKSLSQKLDKKFDHLYEILSSSRFLKMETSKNEVPFFISSFPPEGQRIADKNIEALKNRLATAGIDVLEVNLYNLCLDILERKGKLQLLIEKEPQMDKTKLLTGLRSSLNVEEVLVPEIAKISREQDYHIAFLTGAGAVYPFIRTHLILNNLQKVFKTRPLVLFFPGQYQYTPTRGATLNLFNLMPGDNYYRAYDLDEYTP
jgi:hypothetical protein